jgi:hypothetical protein
MTRCGASHIDPCVATENLLTTVLFEMGKRILPALLEVIASIADAISAIMYGTVLAEHQAVVAEKRGLNAAT